MTGRGRPSEGVRVDIRIPADVLATIDAHAAEMDTTRAAVIRDMLEEATREITR